MGENQITALVEASITKPVNEIMQNALTPTEKQERDEA